MSVLFKIRGKQAVELAGYALAAATIADEMACKARLANGENFESPEDTDSELTPHSLNVVADAYRFAAHACFAELSRIIEDCK